MSAIPVVPPIDFAQSVMHVGSATPSAQPSPALTQKFAALMHRTENVAPVAAAPGHNIAADLLQGEQNKISGLESGMQNLMQDMPNMSSSELMEAGMVLSHDATVMSVKMQVATSLTEGSHKSLDSLLKNS